MGEDYSLDVSGLKAPTLAKLMQAAGGGASQLGISASEAVNAFTQMAEMLERTGGLTAKPIIEEQLLVAMKANGAGGDWIVLDDEPKKKAAQQLKDRAPDLIELALIRGRAHIRLASA